MITMAVDYFSTIIPWNRRISSFDVLVASFLIAWLYFGNIVFLIRKKRDKKYPPFAPGGMWNHLKMATNSQYPWWLLDVANRFQYHVFQLSFPIAPTKHFFIVGDAQVMRTILTDPLSKRPSRLYANLKNIQGANTMLVMNGHGWYKKRKAASPAFSSNQVKRMTRVALEKTEEWIQDTLTGTDDNSSFDCSEEMLFIVLSALAETAFEYSMSKNEITMFRQDISLAHVEFTRKSSANPLRPYFGRFLPERQRAILAVKNLRSMVGHIMDTYRNKKEHANSGTIIDLVLESEDAFPTDDEKAAQLIEFLTAGHDTTAFTISWILLCLARHPDEQSKLRESLSQLSPENWRNSEYLSRVIKEGMRLYPVARSIRLTGRDIDTTYGLIPTGSICSFHFLLVFRNPDIFKEPDSYMPSRWEDPTRDMLDAFNPYSLGKQNCVGQTLAKAETYAIVARICSEFELTVECEGTSDFSLTLKPQGVRLSARKVA